MNSINNICLIEKADKKEYLENITYPLSFSPEEGETISLKALVFGGTFKTDFLFEKKNASGNLHILYLGATSARIDINCRMFHACGQTLSAQNIKGIALDEACISFNGLIKIAPMAQKTTGTQQHRGLLLGEKALIQTAPALEIDADDVLCSHGSAIGSLDKNQLFYARTRGIPEKEAKLLLIRSFLGESLPDEFKDIFEKWIEKHV